MENLQGTVETITYRSDDSGYTVLRLSKESGGTTATCVGTMPTLEAGESVLLQGSWDNHKRFGPQFVVHSYEFIRPTTAQGILRLLSSGFIANIGPGRAEKIIATFGLQTLDILDNQPHRLTEVAGIGKKTMQKIAESWNQQRQVRRLMLFLQEFGVTLNLAFKIYKTYGSEAQAKISADPYILVEDIWGVGFKKADALAQKLGFNPQSYKRVRAGLVYLLQEAAGTGHCYVPRNELLDTAQALLEVEAGLAQSSLAHALESRLFIADEERIYLPLYFNAEQRVGELLAQRVKRPFNTPFSKAQLEQWLSRETKQSSWQPDARQASAFYQALNNSVFILTGGPGTGKTTTLQVIVAFLRQHNLRVSLAAPTGRAAQRMGSVSGLQALTLHRLLEFRPSPSGFSFGRNEANPIEADVVIVDEVSMVDILLMRHLLEALPPQARIIFVGDSNQLPSVGPGTVLADMIGSELIPHVELTTIFRQAARSSIVRYAHLIIQGTTPRFSNAVEDNCFFISEPEPEPCCQAVVDLVSNRLPSRYGFNPISDIQVLTPMHKGPLGTKALNDALQQRLNPSRRVIVKGENRFGCDDKVMQLRNNYEKGVFNGDIGFVRSISEDSEVSVDFDGRLVQYSQRELDELVLAYCISIHKSQGSEFKVAVIVVATQHFVMLQRNLVYTALTRARELCVFAGTYRALSIAVNNNQSLHRYSGLIRRIDQ